MKKEGLVSIVENYLKSNINEMFTGREITEWIMENKKEFCEAKRKNSKQDLSSNINLMSQIRAEIATNKDILKKKGIFYTGNRPMKFFYSEDSLKVDEKTIIEDKKLEKDLYPILSDYLYKELGILSKRIDESKSKNNKGKNGNKWLYPDVVGIKDISENMENETKEFIKYVGLEKHNLYSFEVKKDITLSNLREYFFQTVSNSSWANFSYLVAESITKDALEELEILSSSFKIGFISLSRTEHEESYIQIPAEYKKSIDVNLINRILEQNSDFKNYIELIKEFYQTGKLKQSDWDI